MTTVSAPPRRISADEFSRMPDTKGFELIDGLLVEKRMGALAAAVGAIITRILSEYAQRTGTGTVFNSEGGFRCFGDDADRVRKPDVSFVSTGRMPLDAIPDGYPAIAPDLVVEVSSPNDLFRDLEVKAEQFLTAGVRRVWIVNPDTRTIRILRPDGSDTRLHEGDTVSGEDVLPGFSCKVTDFFPPRPRPSPAT